MHVKNAALVLTITQQEKSINELRARTYQDLQGLGSLLPSLSKGKELIDRYEGYASKSKTLVDRFFVTAIEGVRKHMNSAGGPKAYRNPVDQKVVDEGLKTVRTQVDVVEGGVTEYGKSEDTLTDAVEGAAEGGEYALFGGDKCELPEEAIVRNEIVPDLYEGNPVWFYPGWRSGKHGPGEIRAASEGESLSASQDTTVSQEDEAYAIPEGGKLFAATSQQGFS